VAPEPVGRSTSVPLASDDRRARHLAAPRIARAARIILAPWAALAAAVAGAVFVVLLPICGIASLAEGFSRACWRAARDAPIGSSPRRGKMSQH